MANNKRGTNKINKKKICNKKKPNICLANFRWFSGTWKFTLINDFS